MKPKVRKSKTNRSILGVGTAILIMFSASVSAQGTPEDPGTNELPPYAHLSNGEINKEAIPLSVAVWGFFMMVIDLENKTSGAGQEFLKSSSGIDEDHANQVLNFLRSAVDDAKQDDRDSHDELCSRKPALISGNSRAALASELRESDSRGATNRSLHVQSLSQVLHPENEAQLIGWVEKNLRPTMQMITIDYDQFLHEANVDVTEFVNRMCEAKVTIQ